MIIIKISNVKELVKKKKGWLVAKIAPFVTDMEVEVERVVINELKETFTEKGVEATIQQFKESSKKGGSYDIKNPSINNKSGNNNVG